MTASITDARELICDHQSEGGATVTHVRGALLASSLQVLKDIEVFEQYRKLHPAAMHEPVLHALAMSWVPIDVAVAHYRACDALALSDAKMQTLAHSLSHRYSDSIFGTMLRTSRKAGIDGPWMALRAQGRFWDRMYLGGGVRADRTGPKDAILEQRGLPLADIPYFRNAHRLWLSSLGELLVRKLHIRLVRSTERGPHTMAFAGSWV